MAKAASEEIRDVWTAFKQDPENEDLRNRLIEEYIPLVRMHAVKYGESLPQMVDVDDLFSAGVFGLIDALYKFKPERKVKFETYSALRIRGAMFDWMRAMDWVPRMVRSRSGKLAAAFQAVEEQHGRPATSEEVADRMNLTLEKFRKFQDSAGVVAVGSLQKQTFENCGKEKLLSDLLEDVAAEDPTETSRHRDLQQLVTMGLSKQERLLIILYYYEGLRMREVGQHLGLSESRISQMHKDLLERIRARLTGRRSEFI